MVLWPMFVGRAAEWRKRRVVRMVYFDHAATTPMRQTAIETWMKYAHELNPGGQYASGRRANAVLAQAREQIAELLGADPVEVVFTGSGTEADNIGVRGLFHATCAEQGQRVVASTIEHSAVLEAVKYLEQHDGAQAVWVPVDRGGHVCEDALVDALSKPAAVATVMLANNETGAIQPIDRVVALAAEHGTPVHVDAVQAVGKLPVDFHELGVTTLAASAHKFGGPRGSGLLLARRSPAPQPVIVGGGQERGLRSGTVDVAAAAATAAALAEAVEQMEQEHEHVEALRKRLIAGLREQVPDVIFTASEPVLPGHVHVMFEGAHADALLMLLDSQGLEASAGSTCSSGVTRMSHVLEAMGIAQPVGLGALRLTLGRTNSVHDVDALVRAIADVVRRARVAGGV